MVVLEQLNVFFVLFNFLVLSINFILLSITAEVPETCGHETPRVKLFIYNKIMQHAFDTAITTTVARILPTCSAYQLDCADSFPE